MKKKEKPSILKMVSNFVKESVAFIKEGAPVCSEEEYTERITLCYECEHFNSKKQSCGICGCFMPAKAGWKTSACPDDPPRWKKLLTDKELKEIEIKNKTQMPAYKSTIDRAKRTEIRIQREHMEKLRRQARIDDSKE